MALELRSVDIDSQGGGYRVLGCLRVIPKFTYADIKRD